jgi:hypothetical protein
MEDRMKKPIDKLTALDTAIEAERRTIECLQGNLQQTREEARKAEETQGRLPYKALGEGEAAALTKAEEVLSKSQARAKSAEIALKAAQDKLDGLQQERQEAFLRITGTNTPVKSLNCSRSMPRS